MKRYFLWTLMISTLGMFAGLPIQAGEITAQDISSYSMLTTANARVAKIDYNTRRLTLERADGSQMNLKVGKEVKNLKEIKVGDMIQTQFYQSIAWEILPPNQIELAGAAIVAASTAPKGEKPALDAVEVIHVAGTIDEINQANATMVLKGPDGKLIPLKVRYPEKLKNITAGDKVAATFTEAMAISIEPAPQK